MTRITTYSLVSMFALVGCAADPPQTATTTQNAIATNAIATNAIATNAIATNAIATNAIATNAIATNAIATNGIVAGAVSHPNIDLALEDPNARVFMEYLVGCALTANQFVTWRSRRTGHRAIFPGALGLCPSWQTAAPDATCRERVSACILARNNAFGIKVQFSLRGTTPTGPLALSDQVPAADVVYGTNDLVHSLEPCTSWSKDPTRDCGWQIESIGVCMPGTTVSIAAGNFARCGTELLGSPGTHDTMLRVCAGTRACDHKDAIDSVDDACIGAGSSLAIEPEVTFDCPSSATYAVMSATELGHPVDATIGSTLIDTSKCDHDPLTTGDALNASCSMCVSAVCEQDSACCTKTWDASCVDRAGVACRYPANEQQAFRWREGSFYGDLFGSQNLNPAKPEVRVNRDSYGVQSRDPITGVWHSDGGQLSNDFIGVVYPHMYACASDNWRHDAAYMAYRVCAGPDPKSGLYTRNCAAQYVERCKNVCNTLDAPPITGDRDAGDCSGFGTSWQWPMTTFLTGPCEAVASATACSTYEAVPIGG